MSDFDRRFRQRQEEFNRDWQRARKWAWVNVAVAIFTWLLVGGFIAWVIIMTMRWLGII